MSEIIENPFNVLFKQLQRMETLIIELRQEVATMKQAAATTVKKKTGIALAMEVTGLAKSTIYNMVSSRTIPHGKKNGRLVFSEDDLKKWWFTDIKRETLEELRDAA